MNKLKVAFLSGLTAICFITGNVFNAYANNLDKISNFKISSISKSRNSQIISTDINQIINKSAFSSNIYKLEKKDFFAHTKLDFKIGNINTDNENQKEKFISKFIPEVPSWAMIAGSAAVFCGSILISQLRAKDSSGRIKPNMNDFSIASVSSISEPKGKTKIGRSFSINFKF